MAISENLLTYRKTLFRRLWFSKIARNFPYFLILFREFHRKCFQFLASLFTEFVFQQPGGVEANQQVLDVVLRYIFHTSVNIPLSQVSPLKAYALDKSPMLRGYFLQQLLKK